MFFNDNIFIKVIYIQNNVQYALNGATNEIATYSYLYSISGLQDINDDITSMSAEYGERASGHGKQLLEVFNALGDSFHQGSDSIHTAGGGVEELYQQSKESMGDIKDVLKEVKENPKDEFISVASLFLGAGYENIKGILAEPLLKFFMDKYIDRGVIGRKGRVGAYVDMGEEGDPLKAFKFKTKLFTDNKSIDVTVRYKIKLALPINVLPEIEMKQRSVVRGWLKGDKSTMVRASEEEESDETSIWDESPFTYGKFIVAKELENYPQRYPKTPNTYGVRSINLDCKTYKDIKNTKSSLKSSVNKFLSKTKDDKGVDSRTFIIVIPEGTLTKEREEMFEELRDEAMALEPSITIIYKEGYGRQTEEG